MGVHLPSVISCTKKVLKGHLAVYVGLDGDKRRYVVPLSCLNSPLFQDLLSRAEEEYEFYHPMGGLTIPCEEHTFVSLLSQMN